MNKDTLESLLKGGVVCAYSNPEMFAELQAEGVVSKFDAWLAPLNRRVETQMVDGAYFLVYCNPLEDEAARSIRAKMRDLLLVARPVFDFMELFMKAGGNVDRLRAGTEVRFHTLMSQIESASELGEHLTRLTQSGKFESRAANHDGRLSFVLGKMAELGMLLELGKGTKTYVATALIDVMYRQIEFIDQHYAMRCADLGSPSKQGDLAL